MNVRKACRAGIINRESSSYMSASITYRSGDRGAGQLCLDIPLIVKLVIPTQPSIADPPQTTTSAISLRQKEVLVAYHIINLCIILLAIG